MHIYSCAYDAAAAAMDLPGGMRMMLPSAVSTACIVPCSAAAACAAACCAPVDADALLLCDDLEPASMRAGVTTE